MANVALVLTGGGARAAYQVGLLRCIADMAPDYRFRILTGVSAGAINAAFLASHPEAVGHSAADLCRLWTGLSAENVFRTDIPAIARRAVLWAARLSMGGTRITPDVRGLLDASPLVGLLGRELSTEGGRIVGIEQNLEAGHLRGVALTTLDYTTGRSCTWVQGCALEGWERSDRSAVKTWLTVEHVLASAALPLLFPAVSLEGSWHGDGGIHQAAPLSPAVHMGATRILAVSTRHHSRSGAGSRVTDPAHERYPPPAQVLGRLFNAAFLDVVDQDAARLDLINELVCDLPPEKRRGMRKIDSLVIRPSVDLSALAREYEPRLPRAFRFMTRGLGTREAHGTDFLSMLMFQPDYIERLIDVGERDATSHRDELARLLDHEGGSS